VNLARYSADLSLVLFSDHPDKNYIGTGQHWNYSRPVRPSIHMPRSMSRINLEIIAIRAERLNSISTDDCRKEGFSGGHDSIPGYMYSATPKEHFYHVWDSIYKNSNENPWVWVIEFKKFD
jgi:hypothetical protein